MSASNVPPQPLFNLDRYPIDRLATASGNSFIDKCRRELAETNVCVLPEFVPGGTIARMAAEAEAMMGHAHYRVHDWNCYISRDHDPSFPDDHPRSRFFDDRSKIVAFDLFGPDSRLRHFYYADCLTPLLAAILGYERLYHSACPFQALNILGFDATDSSPWHFDQENEFTVTLQLQTAETGGRFEIVPNLRSEDHENYPGVQQILDGSQERVRSHALEAGTLTVFRGRDSLHRVTPVEGDTRRLVAVMVFEQQPGISYSAEMNAIVYGKRVAALVSQPET